MCCTLSHLATDLHELQQLALVALEQPPQAVDVPGDELEAVGGLRWPGERLARRARHSRRLLRGGSGSLGFLAGELEKLNG